MPRAARVVLPDVPVHLIQRGNNRGQIFFTSQDASLFLEWLENAAVRYEVAVHAYVLMTNHLHLLATPKQPDGLAKVMRSVGTRYAMHINMTRQRTGALWEGRYRTALIDTERYFLTCSRYIELNPVRAGLAKTPGAYRWSSYRHNIGERSDSLVSTHSIFKTLGADRAEQCKSYRVLCEEALPESTLERIRASINSGQILAEESFITVLEQQTGKTLTRPRRGRPHAVARISDA